MNSLSFAINSISVVGVLVEIVCVWLFIAKRHIHTLPLVFIDLLRTHATESVLEENAFWELETCINQERVDGVIAGNVPLLRIAS